MSSIRNRWSPSALTTSMFDLLSQIFSFIESWSSLISSLRSAWSFGVKDHRVLLTIGLANLGSRNAASPPPKSSAGHSRKRVSFCCHYQDMRWLHTTHAWRKWKYWAFNRVPVQMQIVLIKDPGVSPRWMIGCSHTGLPNSFIVFAGITTYLNTSLSLEFPDIEFCFIVERRVWVCILQFDKVLSDTFFHSFHPSIVKLLSHNNTFGILTLLTTKLSKA